jgi:hypothetical protein
MKTVFRAAVVIVLATGVASLARASLKLQATQSSQASTTSQGAQAPGSTANGTPASTQGAPTATAHSLHFITLKFDYDFTKTPACSVTVKTACVEEFIAYDISAGVKHRTKLFEIPLPPKPVGRVSGITAKSPTELDFESGKHILSVVAREPDGTESKHRVCTTWIEIP